MPLEGRPRERGMTADPALTSTYRWLTCSEL